MPYPNTVLSAWQLAVIALVPVAALTAWLVAIFLAARPSRRADQAALTSHPARPGAAGTEQPTAAGEPEPARQAGRREAA